MSDIITPKPEIDPEYREGFEVSLKSRDNRPIRKDGWDFRMGDPELWQRMPELLIPGGNLLDVGMGAARTSLPFAMYGMNVQGYDLKAEDLAYVNAWAEGYGLPIHGEVADVTQVDFGEGIYDGIIFNQIFVHFPDTETALGVIERAIKALKPGGWIYFRVAGTNDDHYRELQDYHLDVPEATGDPNVFYQICGCSGEIEPHMFFDYQAIMAFFETHGMQITHSQVAPAIGGVNVMYGEDWHFEPPAHRQIQLITLLMRKKAPTEEIPQP